MNQRLELPKEEMRNYGYRVIDHLVEHFDSQEYKRPVCLASRAQMEELLNSEIPLESSIPEDVLDHVVNDIMGNCGVISHPKAYAFVPGPSNFIGGLADALASGFNVFSGSWMGAPAAAQTEIILINWLLDMFGLPIKNGGGLFTSGGSMANLTAIVTARRVKCGENFANATVYLSDQAHSSNIKALNILGFRRDQIRIIPTDVEFKLSINKLKNAISIDKLDGKRPLCVIASAGTTNTGTVDPLGLLADICDDEDLWFHVDAAYGGAAIISDDHRHELEGIERASSITVDPHKWFFQPYEIGCLLVRNRRWLANTFTEKPEYLRDVEGNQSEINFYDYGIQLTRSFKALKMYMTLKTFGLNAFKQAIDYNIDLAERVENILRKSEVWEIVSPASLAVINFRFNPYKMNHSETQLDQINQNISKNIIQSGEALLTTTKIHNQLVLRMCLINPRTTIHHVMETLEKCEQFANEGSLE